MHYGLRRCFSQARDEKGCTALHLAAAARQADNVELLLSLGADPRAQDASGNTALHAVVAAVGGAGAKIKIIESLARRYQDAPLAKNAAGQTPLDLASNQQVYFCAHGSNDSCQCMDQNTSVRIARFTQCEVLGPTLRVRHLMKPV